MRIEVERRIFIGGKWIHHIRTEKCIFFSINLLRSIELNEETTSKLNLMMSTVVTLPLTMTEPSPNTLRSYGITQPISTKHPDSSDHQSSKYLEDALRSYDYFESNDELSHRIDVMRKINVLVREWIRTISCEKNISSDMIENLTDCVHTFGSYRLGVHSKGKRR